ncbi:Transmembrane protein [Fagus crenata]|uniref:Transmembrane protein n=1 Tax=Fagus sylvatica TaxID=28930 RepID=A0A2N9FKX1_FAGSY
MANEQQSSSLRPWFLDVVPLMVVVLIAAHVFALVYWIYRLATEKQPQRRKAH